MESWDVLYTEHTSCLLLEERCLGLLQVLLAEKVAMKELSRINASVHRETA